MAVVPFWPAVALTCLWMGVAIRLGPSFVQGSFVSCRLRPGYPGPMAAWVCQACLPVLVHLRRSGPKEEVLLPQESRVSGWIDWDLRQPSMLWLSSEHGI